MKSLKNKGFYLVIQLTGAVILLFIIAPVGSLFVKSTPNQFFNTAMDNEVRQSIALTLSTSMMATLVFAIFAIPFAYFLARKSFPGKKIVLGIIDLPVVIPHSAAGIALLGVISRDTVLGSMANRLGFDFVSNAAGIAVAMAFVSLPFLINAARDGFLAVPEKLEKAALSLGAPPAKVFFKISLPLAWRSILSGLIMMFARGMSEFGAVVIIAYHPMIAPVMIYERFGAFGLSYSRPMAALFVAVCLVFFVFLRFLIKQKKNA